MRITLSKRLVTFFTVAAITAGPQLAAWPGRQPTVTTLSAGAAPPGQAGRAATRAAVIRYWTPERMATTLRRAAGRQGGHLTASAGTGSAGTGSQGAEQRRRLVRKAPPAPTAPWLTGNTHGTGRRWRHGGAVAAATGKAFFTLGSKDYVCSGTLVGGQPDVVLTAAHCVSGGTGSDGSPELATNWMFAPGYDDGLLPYGEYTARRFFVSQDWTGPADGSEQYDVAFVQITPATATGAPGTAKEPPGLPLQFTVTQDSPVPGPAYLFGYPAEPPYTGWYLSYCAGQVTSAAGSARTPCGMTAGDSGGPWLAGFSPRAGVGTVVAVSTYKLSGEPRVLYGAVLGPQARELYRQAVSTAR